jgi:hypothetical protein
LKVECAKRKDDNPRFTRKYNKWKTDNFVNCINLVGSVLHPINRLRLENHVAMIRLKELPVGFRVLSGEVALIESFPDDQKQYIRRNILSAQTNQPEKINCIVIYEVQAIDSANICFIIYERYILGPYSSLADIQERASVDNGRHAELIKMLNKEL